LAKKLAFLHKTKLNYAKIGSLHWFLRKTPIFCRKLATIAENCDQNINPGLPNFSWHNIPKRGKMYQMTTKYNKWPQKYQMAGR
jgi:hypothetical protein